MQFSHPNFRWPKYQIVGFPYQIGNLCPIITKYLRISDKKSSSGINLSVPNFEN